MVAVIRANKSIRQSFFYNENKVCSGVARLLLAENFHKPLAELSSRDTLSMLTKMAALSAAKVNCVHISLNFDPKEALSDEVFALIAKAYMQGIGFDNQPYLVYRHLDAAHPHLHVVTTNIQADGSRIDLHHLASRKSEGIRKEIEKDFGLIRAEGQVKASDLCVPLAAEVAVYGKSQVRRAIANVLANVIPGYAYASLPELNAVLGAYNIMVERGLEGSRLFRFGGLNYRVLGADGRPVGVPIKASLLPGKPILKSLEKRFQVNLKRKESGRLSLKQRIDLTLLSGRVKDMDGLVLALKKEGVNVVLRVNESGLRYGITYVDHRSKCVFNGSALGKAYGLKGVEERIAGAGLAAGNRKDLFGGFALAKGKPDFNKGHEVGEQRGHHSGGLLEVLTGVEQAYEALPYALKRKRGRKKRKSGNRI